MKTRNEHPTATLRPATARKAPRYASAAEWPAWTDQEVWGDANGVESCHVDTFDIGLVATCLLGIDTETALRRLVAGGRRHPGEVGP